MRKFYCLRQTWVQTILFVLLSAVSVSVPISIVYGASLLSKSTIERHKIVLDLDFALDNMTGVTKTQLARRAALIVSQVLNKNDIAFPFDWKNIVVAERNSSTAAQSRFIGERSNSIHAQKQIDRTSSVQNILTPGPTTYFRVSFAAFFRQIEEARTFERKSKSAIVEIQRELLTTFSLDEVIVQVTADKSAALVEVIEVVENAFNLQDEILIAPLTCVWLPAKQNITIRGLNQSDVNETMRVTVLGEQLMPLLVLNNKRVSYVTGEIPIKENDSIKFRMCTTSAHSTASSVTFTSKGKTDTILINTGAYSPPPPNPPPPPPSPPPPLPPPPSPPLFADAFSFNQTFGDEAAPGTCRIFGPIRSSGYFNATLTRVNASEGGRKLLSMAAEPRDNSIKPLGMQVSTRLDFTSSTMEFKITGRVGPIVRDLWLSNYGGFASDEKVNNSVSGPPDGRDAFVANGTTDQERSVIITVDRNYNQTYVWSFNARCNATKCMTILSDSPLCDVAYRELLEWGNGYTYDILVTCSNLTAAASNMTLRLCRNGTSGEVGSIETLDLHTEDALPLSRWTTTLNPQPSTSRSSSVGSIKLYVKGVAAESNFAWITPDDDVTVQICSPGHREVVSAELSFGGQSATVTLGTSRYQWESRNNLLDAVYNCWENFDETLVNCSRVQCGGYNCGPIGTWDVSKVTDMSDMFLLYAHFNADISAWNVSAATNMNRMFDKAKAFNQDISSWDVSAVTDMEGMFRDAESFNQDIGSWNMSAARSISEMFHGASVFNGNIGSWNMSGVRSTSEVFYGASAFNQDISAWNTAAVTDMSSMFQDASNFNQNIGGWNTAAVTTMSFMFREAVNFNQNISGWNTAAVTTMSNMFLLATSFNQDISGWDVKNVKIMLRMFLEASTFSYDITQWNTDSLTNSREMFSQASAWHEKYSRNGPGSSSNDGPPSNWTARFDPSSSTSLSSASLSNVDSPLSPSLPLTPALPSPSPPPSVPLAAPPVVVTFDGRLYEACLGTSVQVNFNGYHDIQELITESCEFGDKSSQGLKSTQAPGTVLTFDNDELSAPPGKTRWFRCSSHCLKKTDDSKFGVHCPFKPVLY